MPLDGFNAKQPEHLNRTLPDSKPQNQAGTSDVMRWSSKQKEVTTDSMHQNQTGTSDVMRWDTESTASNYSEYSDISDQGNQEIISAAAVRKLTKGAPELIDRGKEKIDNPGYLRKFVGENNTRNQMLGNLSLLDEGSVNHETLEERERIDSVVQEWRTRGAEERMVQERRTRGAEEKVLDEWLRSADGSELQQMPSQQFDEEMVRNEWRQSGEGAALQRMPSRRLDQQIKLEGDDKE